MSEYCNVAIYKRTGDINRPYTQPWSTKTSNPSGHLRECKDARFELQKGDGNLVLYDGNGKVLWAVHKHGGRGGDRLVMQNDGNCVLYDGQQSIWASGTDKPNKHGSG